MEMSQDNMEKEKYEEDYRTKPWEDADTYMAGSFELREEGACNACNERTHLCCRSCGWYACMNHRNHPCPPTTSSDSEHTPSTNWDRCLLELTQPENDL